MKIVIFIFGEIREQFNFQEQPIQQTQMLKYHQCLGMAHKLNLAKIDEADLSGRKKVLI